MIVKVIPRGGARRKPEKPGQVASRMAALRARRKELGQHRVELWLTDSEDRAVRDQVHRLRNPNHP